MVTVGPDQLVFASPEAAHEGWQPGDILAGDFVPGSAGNPAGFLRRVTSLETSGDQLVVHTEPAALTDAIDTGELTTSFPLELDPDDPPEPSVRRTQPGATVAAGLSIGPVGKRAVEIKLEKKGDPDIALTGGFGIKDMSASLNLMLDVGLQIKRFSVKHAHTIVSGDLAANIVPFVQVGMELALKTDIRSRLDFRNWLDDQALHLTPFEIQFPDRKTKTYRLVVGDVPVVVSGILKSSVSCILQASGKFEASIDLGYHGQTRAGVLYENGIGTTILEGSAMSAVTPDYSYAVGGSLKCKASVQLGLQFYGITDVLVGLEPHADVDVTEAPQCSGTNFVPKASGQTTLTYGLNGTLGVEIADFLHFLGVKLEVKAPDIELATSGPLLLGDTGDPSGGDHCPCGNRDEVCCNTLVVNGEPCDPGLECSSSGVCKDDGRLPSVVGHVWGDPHVVTFDGALFDFQRVGEFVVVTSRTGLLIQMRTAPFDHSTTVAKVIAIAANVHGDIVEIDAGPDATTVLVNGKPPTTMALPGGGTLSASRITWPDRSYLEFANRSGRLDLSVGVVPGTDVHGLLGDANGNASDDLQLQDGTVLPRPVTAAGFGSLVEAWRIPDDAASMFTYPSGKGTIDFTNREFPTAPVTASELPPDVQASARSICTAAGVTDASLLDACILDIGTIGNPDLALAASESRPPVTTVPPPPEACGWVPEHQQLRLQCPAGLTMQSITFASYGFPTVTGCGSFAVTGCNAASSVGVIQAQCIGKSSCSVLAENSVFMDPCPFVVKRLAVEISCEP